MEIGFKKVSNFKRGILFNLLSDAYSYDTRWKYYCETNWKEFDNFFFDNLQIADTYGFITTLNNEALNRILPNDVNKVIVTTNEQLVPAQRMYESVGFQFCQRRTNSNNAEVAGEHIDYEIVL